MTHTQTRRYEMLVRVRDFGEQHRDLFPQDTVAGQALASLDTAVAQLSTHAVSKMKTTGDGVTARRSARAELRRRLTAMARSARAIARTQPGFDERFRLPDQPTDQTILTAGRMFLDESQGAAKATFLEYGMWPDFGTTLSAVVEAFATSLRSVEAGRDGRTEARAAIEAALETGFEAVRQLDVIVANRLQDDPVTLAVWERDRKIETRLRRGRRVAKSDTPPAATPETFQEVAS